tara:strand:- start:261 stop:614 length:354 start_codon:yes stop_codon:yes gene_type:complete
MSSKFTSGKHAIGNCDVCGFQYKLNDLRDLFIRTKDSYVKACNECWNPDQPQNMQGMYPVNDPQAVRNPRPDINLKEQRDIQWGWEPVGLNNPLQLAGLPDNLEAESQVGDVIIEIT